MYSEWQISILWGFATLCALVKAKMKGEGNINE